MIKEFGRVILKKDLQGTRFIRGDVGTVVLIYPDERAYEIEFFALDGTTLGVETVMKDDLISAEGIKQVFHVQV
jgi:hypothetical protein